MSDDAKPKEADADSVDDAEDGEETPKKKGMGLIPMAIAGVVAAGAAGGAAFVLTPSGSEDTVCITDDHAAEDSHDKDEQSDTGEKDATAEDCVPEDEVKKDDDKKKKKADKKKDDGHGGKDGGASTIKPLGEVQYSEHATFLVMEPMIVSIAPIGRSRHLKVSLVLETTEGGAEALLENGYYVQDVLNTFLRSVDAGVLEDPASMSRLRAQILRRIRAIVPDAEVSNVLITEFVLT